MNTVAAWLKAHPGVNVLAFERNSDKSFGFGEWEEVCGFCLASHFFEERPPTNCKFCRASLRDTHAISDLPEIINRTYDFGSFVVGSRPPEHKLPFIVRDRS